MGLDKKIFAAAGMKKVDLLLKNARIVDVFSGEIVDGDLALDGGYIAGWGDYEAEKTIDLKGRYVAPGFIDSHMHIESSMASVSGFVREVLPLGTTSVAADPHEIANVLGRAGLDYMLASAAGQPMNVRFALPSCVPATHMETSGAELLAEDLADYFHHDKVLGLGEFMNYPGVINGDPEALKKISSAHASGKPVDGHAPSVTGKELNAYAAAGISSDHECTTAEEALEKIRCGMHIMVREGTCARNLEDLAPIINERTCGRLMLCTDDRHPQDILDEGHMDSVVRKAIRLGVDPVTAIRMATINPAQYFGLKDAGALAPGRRADLVVFSDLNDLVVEDVYFGGAHVASKGALLPEVPVPVSPKAPSAMNLPVSDIDFSIPAETGRIRVIDVQESQVVTECLLADPRVEQGMVVSDTDRDILKIAVIERYSGKAGMGKGFVKGFGLKKGAMASSVAHDSHNIIVIGTNDADMNAAVRAVTESGGGFAVVCDGLRLATLPLPIAGLLSDLPMPEIRKQMDAVLAACSRLGAALEDPFISMGFLSLPVIPDLKITDKGLVDVKAFKVVSLFV